MNNDNKEVSSPVRRRRRVEVRGGGSQGDSGRGQNLSEGGSWDETADGVAEGNGSRSNNSSSVISGSNGNGLRRRGSAPRQSRNVVDAEPDTGYEDSEEGEEITTSLNNLSFTDLKQKKFEELVKVANSIHLEGATLMTRQDLIFNILIHHASRGGQIYGQGVLECLPDGFGFLRSTTSNYMPGSDDLYVSPNQIKRFGLKTGDTVEGQIRSPREKEGERYFALLKITSVNDDNVEFLRNRISYDNFTAEYPSEKLNLDGQTENVSARIIDMFAPIGKGQRGLIVAPPKAGKTIFLKDLARAITTNHKEVHLMVLLIDERPEEVTDMLRSVDGEVISSTFDEPASRHVQVAEMVIEKAKRLVEHKRDVVILLDSITRLARAYNSVAPASGRVLSGGVDSNALYKPRRLFAAARKCIEGGSLTIIGTALVDTGSRMDEVIFEEFKGTGNMELVLDRRLAEKRIFPAIDLSKSQTRMEELLLDPEVRQKVWLLRRSIVNESADRATESLVSKIVGTKNNQEFMDMMKG